MEMEVDTKGLVVKYPHVSEEEVDEIRTSKLYRGLYQTTMDRAVGVLNHIRECDKVYGKESVMVGSLIHLLSAKFLPSPNYYHKPSLAISGKIFVQFFDNNCQKLMFHNLFDRNSDDAQLLGLDDNYLTLTNPQSWPLGIMAPHFTSCVLDLVVGDKRLGIKYISCDDNDDSIECDRVKEKHVHSEVGEFVLRYITMPFGVYGEVKIVFFHKYGCNLLGRNHEFVDVKGRVSARYYNPYQVYNSEHCLLFDKQANEYERIEFEQYKGSMKLSRFWVGLPINSSLFLDLNLLEFESQRELLNKSVEFRVKNQDFSYKDFIVDDLLIRVSVGWTSPMPQRPMPQGRQGPMPQGTEKECDSDESSDEEMSLQEASGNNSDDEHVIECSDREASTNPMHPWLGVHQTRPCPSSLVQIYSIYIHRDQCKDLQVYGSFEISTLGTTIYSFNRGIGDAFVFLKGSKTIPMLDGYLVYDDSDSLCMKIEISDIEKSMNIKGYINWDDRSLEFGTKWLNKPLCSVIDGEGGFAAIHYSLFPKALKADLRVYCMPKENGSECVKMFPKVHGDIVAYHNSFDYISHYERQYYRVVLFQKNEEDPLQIGDNGEISLSRSLVVVPMRSSLTVDLNLCLCGEDDQDIFNSTVDLGHIKNVINIKHESSSYWIQIVVKWVE